MFLFHGESQRKSIAFDSLLYRNSKEMFQNGKTNELNEYSHKESTLKETQVSVRTIKHFFFNSLVITFFTL